MRHLHAFKVRLNFLAVYCGDFDPQYQTKRSSSDFVQRATLSHNHVVNGKSSLDKFFP